MTKTPYEIRLEVLKMAADIEMQLYHANRERLHQNWQAAADAAASRGAKPPPYPAVESFPTPEGITAKAKFLSEFIDNKGKPLNG